MAYLIKLWSVFPIWVRTHLYILHSYTNKIYLYKILIMKHKLEYINDTYDKGAIFLLYKSLYKSTWKGSTTSKTGEQKTCMYVYKEVNTIALLKFTSSLNAN